MKVRGTTVEAEFAPQGVDRILGALIGLEALQPEALEQVAGVLVGQVAPAAAVPRTRHGESGLRQQLLEGRHFTGVEGQHDPGRLVGEGYVPPDQEEGEHIGVDFSLHVLEEAVLPADDPPVAYPEHDADGVVAVARVADHVGVSGADDLHGRRGLQLVEPLHRVPEIPGALDSPRASARLVHHGRGCAP